MPEVGIGKSFKKDFHFSAFGFVKQFLFSIWYTHKTPYASNNWTVNTEVDGGNQNLQPEILANTNSSTKQAHEHVPPKNNIKT